MNISYFVTIFVLVGVAGKVSRFILAGRSSRSETEIDDDRVRTDECALNTEGVWLFAVD